MTEEPKAEVSKPEDVTIVHFAKMSFADRFSVEAEFEKLLTTIVPGPGLKVLLNCKGLEYISSRALGKLVTLHKRIIERSGILKLCALEPQVYTIMRTTELNQVLDIYEDEESALRSFAETN